jgi:hypothetical protein
MGARTPDRLHENKENAMRRFLYMLGSMFMMRALARRFGRQPVAYRRY